MFVKRIFPRVFDIMHCAYKKRRCSSVGQSMRLISAVSGVRFPAPPPFFSYTYMNESFLSVSKTILHCERNLAEWHRGVSHYGFWAVLVDDQGWLELFEAARAHVERFLHPGYRRAPHITVAACGLLSEEHFSPTLQRHQATALNKANVPPFFLRAAMLDSFASAPYITVEDQDGSLDTLRSILAMISQEDNPAEYKPHIALGLYQEAFETLLVAHHLREFRSVATRQLPVTELAFCAYETSDLQGPFGVVERVALAGPDRTKGVLGSAP